MRKNMIRLTNHMPAIKDMQMKLTEARNFGDHMESMLETFCIDEILF